VSIKGLRLYLLFLIEPLPGSVSKKKLTLQMFKFFKPLMIISL